MKIVRIYAPYFFMGRSIEASCKICEKKISFVGVTDDIFIQEGALLRRPNLKECEELIRKEQFCHICRQVFNRDRFKEGWD